MDFQTARTLAIATGNALLPHCDKLNIAGSIRRKKAQVKDIEIICLPKTGVMTTDLFATPEVVIDPEFERTVFSLGRVEKGEPSGRYMKILLPDNIALDLFLPVPHDYYRQYAIRTGSADYSARVIAGGWVAKGWCGSDMGLRKQSDCQQRINGGKKTWVCWNPDAEKPPVWESEQAFFEWLGVDWIAPELRN